MQSNPWISPPRPGAAGQVYASPVFTGGATSLSGGYRTYNGAATASTEYGHMEWAANFLNYGSVTNGGIARSTRYGSASSIILNAGGNDLVVLDATHLYPLADSALSFGRTAERWLALYTDQLIVDLTITPALTVGAQTINKAAGTVNFAAGAASLVVTNSLVTANSLVMTFIRTNDATAILGITTCAAGSFTIRMSTVPTAETSVGFFVVNG